MKYANLEMIRFEKSSSVRERKKTNLIIFVTHSFPKILSTIAIVSEFILLESFPAFFLVEE